MGDKYPQVDISKHPEVINKAESPRHDVIGDTHGNAMYMIFFLIERGYLTLADKSHYDDLKRICETDYKALFAKGEIAQTKYLFRKFITILSQATFDAQNSKITFLGDMLADRWTNDTFTLILLLLLHRAGINYNITLSNHDAVFLSFIFDKLWTQDTFQSKLKNKTDRSAEGLFDFIKQGIVDAEEIKNIVKEAFLSHLVLFDYSQYTEGHNKEQFVQWTHAPTGDEILTSLLYKFNIPLVLNPNISQRKTLLDNINQAFKSKIIDEQQLKQILDEIHGQHQVNLGMAYLYITWNRGSRLLSRAEDIHYGHGHHTPQKNNNLNKLKNYICLNGELGKANSEKNVTEPGCVIEEGIYQVFSCSWQPPEPINDPNRFFSVKPENPKPPEEENVEIRGRFRITRQGPG